MTLKEKEEPQMTRMTQIKKLIILMYRERSRSRDGVLI